MVAEGGVWSAVGVGAGLYPKAVAGGAFKRLL